MRAMKNSGIEWIGEIPKEWEIAELKRLGIPATGSTPSKDNSDYWDGDIPWVSAKDMKSDYLLDSDDHITQTAVDECGLTLFASGALIFCVRSGILRHTFPVAVATIPVTINQDLRALSLTGDVNPAFLLYYMRGMNGTIVTLYQKIGATVESIEMDWLLYFPVVLPPREEQNHIVEYLDAKCAEIDALIAAKERTNALLKERRQSIIYEAVTKSLDPTVPMKDSGVEWIGEIPEGWKITALKRLGTPATGSTPSKDNADYWDGDIPWVSSKDMKSDYLLDSEDHITQTAVDECGLTLFASGALIFCVRSGILRHTFPVAVATIPVTINQDLRALSMTGDVNPAFVLYYMRGMNDIIVRLYQKIGATVESIEMDWFLYFPVVLPTREEQDRIVEALDSRCTSLDHTVMQNEATIRQLKEYRQSLIYEAITGKIEV